MYSRVIARFIPLCDVMLCLLGMFLVLGLSVDTQESRTLAYMSEFFYARPDGVCWHVSSGKQLDIKIASDEAIRQFFNEQIDSGSAETLLIIFSLPMEGGAFWSEERVQSIREILRLPQDRREQLVYLLDFPFVLPPCIQPLDLQNE